MTVLSGSFSAAELECTLLTIHATRELKFKPLTSFQWLIEATTIQQSEKYLTIKKIGKAEVKVEKHETLNSIQGTVVLAPSYNEEGLPNHNLLLMSLQARGYDCRKVDLYEISSKHTPSQKLRIANITFEGNNLPQHIIIEGVRKEVRPYIPKPFQCKQCSQFGHTHKKCSNNEVCAFCGSTEHKTRWNCGTPKCANCNGPHHARSKDCTFYQYNTELKLLMTRSGLNVHEARRELYIRGIKDPAQSNTYSFVSKPGSSTEISKKDQGQSSSKVKSQTLLHNKNDNTTVSPNELSVVIPEQHFKTTRVSDMVKDDSLKGASVIPHNNGEEACEVDIVSERTTDRQKRSLTPDAIDTRNRYEVLEETEDLSQTSVVLGRIGPKLRRTRSADRKKD